MNSATLFGNFADNHKHSFWRINYQIRKHATLTTTLQQNNKLIKQFIHFTLLYVHALHSSG